MRRRPVLRYMERLWASDIALTALLVFLLIYIFFLYPLGQIGAFRALSTGFWSLILITGAITASRNRIFNAGNPTSLTVDSDYKDTWHVALGVQYRHSPVWTFTGGIAYDSSAVDDDKRSVTVPMGEIWGFALGAQYSISPNVTLGGAYQFAWLGDMPVDQERGPLAGRVAGEFGNSTFSFLGLNLKWTF